MKFDNILYDVKDLIATITINRPEKLNSLSVGTIRDISGALADADINEDVRVVVITGAGRAFCAGDDLEEFMVIDKAGGRAFTKAYMAMCLDIEKLTKPVIAAINGIAIGGGFELTMACDLAIAAEDVKFSLPEVRVGAWPGFAVIRLPDLIGHRKARELLLTCDIIDAKQAEELRLINKAVPADQLMMAVKELAQKIITNSPSSVNMTKASYNGAAWGRELTFTNTNPIMIFSSEDFKEGVDAALNKRMPNFNKKK